MRKTSERWTKRLSSVLSLVVGLVLLFSSLFGFLQLSILTYPDNTPNNALWVYYATQDDVRKHTPDIGLKPVPETYDCFIYIKPFANASAVIPGLVAFPVLTNTSPVVTGIFGNSTHIIIVQNRTVMFCMSQRFYPLQMLTVLEIRFPVSGFGDEEVWIRWFNCISRLDFDTWEYQFSREGLHYQGEYINLSCGESANNATISLVLEPALTIDLLLTFPYPDELRHEITPTPTGLRYTTLRYVWEQDQNPIRMVFSLGDLTRLGELGGFIFGLVFSAGISLVIGGSVIFKSLLKKKENPSIGTLFE